MIDTDPEQILLVEDNPADARLIQEYVRERAWPKLDDKQPTIERAERLADAVAAHSETTDIVLLDLGLPDSSGLETLEQMLDVTSDAPIVVLTGLDDESTGLEAVERGAQNYLVKNDLTPKLLQQTLRFAIERERQQQQLQRRNQELAILNQIVRHDIRNDVAVIVAWSETLRGHVDDSGQDSLDRILDASDHITTLTDTVRDFLEVLEGDGEPDLKPVAVGEILTSEVQKAQETYEDATITVTSDISVGTRVLATDLLSSVFRNLLSNAVTHNDAETPEIAVEATESATGVEVRVADNGPGVPEDRRDEIFGRGEMGLESPGSGIGLYLVDTLVEMYGGEVRVDESDAGGAAFTVELSTET